MGRIVISKWATKPLQGRLGVLVRLPVGWRSSFQAQRILEANQGEREKHGEEKKGHEDKGHDGAHSMRQAHPWPVYVEEGTGQEETQGEKKETQSAEERSEELAVLALSPPEEEGAQEEKSDT